MFVTSISKQKLLFLLFSMVYLSLTQLLQIMIFVKKKIKIAKIFITNRLATNIPINSKSIATIIISLSINISDIFCSIFVFFS